MSITKMKLMSWKREERSMSTAPTLPSTRTEKQFLLAGLKKAAVRTTTAKEQRMVATTCMPVKALSVSRQAFIDGARASVAETLRRVQW